MQGDASRTPRAPVRFVIIAALAIIALLVPFGSGPCAQPGIRVGISAATLSIPDDEGRPFFGREIEWLIWSKAPGLHLGAFYHFTLSRHVGILGELSYVRRGMSGDTRFLFDDIEYRIALDYLEFPVPVTVTLPISSSLDAIMMAGPYGAILLQASRQSRIDGVTERVDLPNAQSFDYGIVLGIAPALTVSGRTLMLDLRYYHGLASIMDPLESSVPISSESGSIKSQSFSMLLGITL